MMGSCTGRALNGRYSFSKKITTGGSMGKGIITVCFIAVCAGMAQEKMSQVVVKEVWSLGETTHVSFTQVGDIACDPEGNVYITDRFAYKVRRFGKNGFFLGEFGRRGKGAGEFIAGPAGLACSRDRLAIVDLGTSRVVLSAPSGEPAGEIVTEAPVADIAFTSRGELYVSTFPSARGEMTIVLYDEKGRRVSGISEGVRHPNEVLSIAVLCVDAEDNLIVGFPYVNKLLVYNRMHERVGEFHLSGLPDEAATPVGAPVPEAEIIRDIAADNRGHLFVLCGGYGAPPNRDVRILNYRGDELGRFLLPEASGVLQIDKKG
jgi:hypothetical protein